MIMTTRFRLYKALGYITSAPRGVEFSLRQPQPRNLLFMFPLQKEHIEASRFLFKKLMQHVKRDLIRVAVADTFRDDLSGPREVVFYYPLLQQSPPVFDLDVMLARFRRETFEAVVNLEPELNVQLARVISVIETPRRIGFSGPFADILYNIQIHPRSNGRLRKSYAQMLKLCDLG